MKKNEKTINFISNRKSYLLNIITQLVIFFVHFSFILNNELTKTLYIKTNGNINEIKKNNESLKNFTNMDTSNNFFRKEIQYEYGEEIIINIIKKRNDTLSLGILFQIGKNFYKLNDSDFIVFINEDNEEKICNEKINITINDTYIEEIAYCYIKNSNETKIKIIIPSQNYDNMNQSNINISSSSQNHGNIYQSNINISSSSENYDNTYQTNINISSPSQNDDNAYQTNRNISPSSQNYENTYQSNINILLSSQNYENTGQSNINISWSFENFENTYQSNINIFSSSQNYDNMNQSNINISSSC